MDQRQYFLDQFIIKHSEAPSLIPLVENLTLEEVTFPDLRLGYGQTAGTVTGLVSESRGWTAQPQTYDKHVIEAGDSEIDLSGLPVYEGPEGIDEIISQGIGAQGVVYTADGVPLGCIVVDENMYPDQALEMLAIAEAYRDTVLTVDTITPTSSVFNANVNFTSTVISGYRITLNEFFVESDMIGFMIPIPKPMVKIPEAYIGQL